MREYQLIIINSDMCYLPLPILKVIVGIGAAASVLLSLGMLGAVIYINFEHKDIIDNANEPVVKNLFIFFYVMSILFLLLAFCGLYGSIKARRKNKLAPCLLSAYLISVIVFFIVFLAMTITMFVAPPAVFGETCKQGSQTSLVKSLYDLTQEAKNKFCTNDCPCYLNSTNINSNLSNWLTAHNRTFNSNTSSYINYKSCMKDTSQEGDGILLGTLEDFLDCGGWCQTDDIPRFLRFSDINFCTTQDCYNQKPACYTQFKNFMVSKGKTMGISSLIASIITLVNLIFVCCICCHPTTRSQKNKNFYARMMESE